MKRFTIIGGVNGVGKSSLYGALDGEICELGVIIDADKFTKQFGGDKIKGGKEAVGLINNCLQNGESFTQETTLSGQKTAKTILLAHENGYQIKLYYIAVSSAEESLLRIENRIRKGGHDIPRSIVIRRFENRFEDLIRVLSLLSQSRDEAVFFDNENGFVRAAKYSGGKLELIGEYRPEWILSLKNILENRK